MKKAQAATEFLITYGWAILTVIIAISALAHFGVLDFNRFMPSICTLGQGLSCLDHNYEKGILTIIIKNNLGNRITIKSVEASGCLPNIQTTEMTNGQSVSKTLICDKLTGDLKVRYITDASGLEFVNEGKSNIHGSDRDQSSAGKTTSWINCANAQNNGICDFLATFTGEADYYLRCCTDWILCC